MIRPFVSITNQVIPFIRNNLKPAQLQRRHFTATMNKQHMRKETQWSEHVRGNLQIEVSADESEAMVVLPGFAYSDFNRIGEINTWSLGMMFQSGKDNVVGSALPSDPGRQYGDFTSLQYGNQIFTLYSHLTIQPHLYTKKAEFYYAPVLFKEYLNKIGRTSIETIRTLFAEHSGLELCQCVQGLVLVNRQHKPNPHPDWYQKKYSHVKHRIEVPKYVPATKPDGSFKVPYTVQWSDTDYNYHTNQFSYVKMVIDAFHSVVYKGLPGFHGDPVRYRPKNLRMLHSAQTEPGDVLLVYVWTDPHQSQRVHSQIDRNGVIVYQASLEFFTDEEINKSSSKL